MSIPDIASCYEGFRRTYNLPSLRLCGLHLTPKVCNAESDLNEVLFDFNPVSGWAQCQSELMLHPSSKSISNWGPILYAELISAERNSLCIQWSSAIRSWRITHYSEVPGDEYLCDETSLFADEVPGNVMRYRRYWRSDEGMRPFASRFVGFGAQLK